MTPPPKPDPPPPPPDLPDGDDPENLPPYEPEHDPDT